MMNIRDYIFINKAKTSNKIKILEILGFETDSYISQSPETIKYKYQDTGISEIPLEEEFENENNIEFDINDINNYNNNETSLEITPTKTLHRTIVPYSPPDRVEKGLEAGTKKPSGESMLFFEPDLGC